MGRWQTVFIALLFFGFTGSSSHLYSWHLFLNKEVSPSSSSVKLKEIGRIYGNDLSDLQRSELEESVVLTIEPQEHRYSGSEIRDLLYQNGIFPETVRGSLNVTPLLREVNSDELLALLSGYYMRNRFFRDGELKIAIDENFKLKVFQGSTLVLNLMERSFTPGVKKAVLADRDFPSVTYAVDYSLQKKTVVYNVNRSIKKGGRILPEDVDEVVTYTADGYATISMENPSGGVALRDLEKGTALTRYDFEKKIDVRAGDTVELVYNQSNILVFMDARARRSGSVGDMIECYIEKTRKTVMARIKSPGKVVYEEQK